MRYFLAGLVIATFASAGLAQGPNARRDTRIADIFADYNKPGSPGCAVAVYIRPPLGWRTSITTFR
jgi:hypothetical protein